MEADSKLVLMSKSNALFTVMNPEKEKFQELLEIITNSNLFEGHPRRFIFDTEKVGRFYVARTKKILGKRITEYQVFYYSDNNSYHPEWVPENTLRGYSLQVKDGIIEAIFRIKGIVLSPGITRDYEKERYL